jgi:hypothetical protein
METKRPVLGTLPTSVRRLSRDPDINRPDLVLGRSAYYRVLYCQKTGDLYINCRQYGHTHTDRRELFSKWENYYEALPSANHWLVGQWNVYLDGSITVIRRTDDYMAHITDNKAHWDCGKTPEEAIGRLIIFHGQDVGISVREDLF